MAAMAPQVLEKPRPMVTIPHRNVAPPSQYLGPKWRRPSCDYCQCMNNTVTHRQLKENVWGEEEECDNVVAVGSEIEFRLHRFIVGGTGEGHILAVDRRDAVHGNQRWDQAVINLSNGGLDKGRVVAVINVDFFFEFLSTRLFGVVIVDMGNVGLHVHLVVYDLVVGRVSPFNVCHF